MVMDHGRCDMVMDHGRCDMVMDHGRCDMVMDHGRCDMVMDHGRCDMVMDHGRCDMVMDHGRCDMVMDPARAKLKTTSKMHWTAVCSGPGEDVSGRDHLLLCSVSPTCSERACCGPTPRCILTPGPLLHRAAPDP
ncbi:unnamed protein product [Gadus morhua 'NCC']